MTVAKNYLAAIFAAALCGTPALAGQGWDYVQSHPMFQASLIEGASPVPQSFLNTYFAGFHVTANCWYSVCSTNTPGIRWIEVGTSPACIGACIGFQIGDEPRTRSEVDAAGAACRAISSLCIINMAPSASWRLVQHAASVADVLSHDSYSPTDGFRDREEARKAATKFGIPLFCYVSTRGGQSDLRWNMNVNLTQGCVGPTWFLHTYRADDGSPATPFMTFFDSFGYGGSPTQSYYWARDINDEVAVLGRALTQMRSYDARYAPASGWFVPIGMSRYPSRGLWGLGGITSTSDVLIGAFRGTDNHDYWAVTNLRHEAGTTPTTLGTWADDICVSGAIRYLDANTGTVINANDGCMNIEAGGIRLFTRPGHPFVGIEPGAVSQAISIPQQTVRHPVMAAIGATAVALILPRILRVSFRF